MIKRLFLLLLVVVLGLAAAVVVNTLRTESRQLQVAPVQKAAVDSQAAAQRLAGAIAFKTIFNPETPDTNADEFYKLHAYLEKTFPKAHATLTREIINGKSLLYTWKGTDPKAKPIALLAHQDVVPIAPGTEKEWKADPFAGEIKDGFIWGRGAWDNKGNLMSQMEAVEMLLASGFQPRQTIYFIMGHDEEVSSQAGAKSIAAMFKERKIQLEWVLDEGLVVTQGILPTDKPAALIGVAEKGYASYQLTVDAVAGHSSMPPAKTSIGTISRALARLEDRQRPAALAGVAREMFETLGPETAGANRFLLTNVWLFKPVLEWQLQKAASTNAMLRTTTALTIVKAGNKENVLPGRSEATVNYRILPGETTDMIEQHVRSAVGDDAVTIKAMPGAVNPTPVSPTSSAGYHAINRTVRETFPPAIVIPALVVGGTDSRFFSDVSDATFRFSPVRARNEDLQLIHGTNERVSVANYTEMIQFYHQLLRNAQNPDSQP